MNHHLFTKAVLWASIHALLFLFVSLRVTPALISLTLSVGMTYVMRVYSENYTNSRNGWADDVWIFGLTMFLIPVTIKLIIDKDRARRREYLLTGGGKVMLNRYVVSPVPVHCSATAKVFYAKDLREDNHQVAIKLMRHSHQFEQEVKSRFGEDRNLNHDAVIELLGWHAPKGVVLPFPSGQTYRREATDHEFACVDQGYPYLLVMERGERSLHDACTKERFSGYNYDNIWSVMSDVAASLQILHKSGMIHGDLKGRNILRVNLKGKWILCDMDASSKMGDPAGLKTSSGNSPPELARLKLSCEPGEHGNPEAQVDAAKASFDIWAYGVLLYEMCCGHVLFTQDMSNNQIVLAADKTKLCLWHTISDHELEGVFSELQPTLDEANRGPSWLKQVRQDAKSLIRWCLKGDPKLRPSLDQVRKHPFFANYNQIDELAQSPRSALSRSAKGASRMQYHMFISHMQAEASGDCGTLFFLLKQLGVHCWRDMNANDLTERGMQQGVHDCECFVLFLTNCVLSRTYCLKEITWALEYGKKIIIVVEQDPRFAAWEYDRWIADKCTRIVGSDQYSTGWVQNSYEEVARNHAEVVAEITKQHQEGTMLPFRRREFEVKALVRQILATAGATWGAQLPPSDVVDQAQLDATRRVRFLIGADAQTTSESIASLGESLKSLSPCLEIVSTVEEASHVVAILTGGILEEEAYLAELSRAVEMEYDVLYMYSSQDGWDFTDFYARPDSAVKAAIAAKEAQVFRARGLGANGGYEWVAMLLELLRRMRPTQVQQEQAAEAVQKEIACEKLERQLSELHDALGTKGSAAMAHCIKTWTTLQASTLLHRWHVQAEVHAARRNRDKDYFSHTRAMPIGNRQWEK